MKNKNNNLLSFWHQSPTVEQGLAGGINLFTPLRMVMALGVLLGHSYKVHYGPEIPEPFSFFNMTISYIAVNGFFILSGLLITRSIDRNPDFIRFFTARFLRLFPAMFAMAILASFVFGPLVSDLSPAAYFTDPMTWRYVVNILSFGDTSGGPPQIFTNNPYPGEWSASLWTLRYEAIAYVGTAVLAWIGVSRSRQLMLAIFVLSVAAFMLVRIEALGLPVQLEDLSRFAVTYMLGAVIYCYRDVIRLSWGVGALICGLALLSGPTVSFEIMLNFVLAAGILLIGFAKLPGRLQMSKMPDFSYGVYIWQWPIMQALWYYDLARDPYTMMALAIPASVIMGALSWYIIEKPVLALKDPAAIWLRSKIKVRKTA